MPDEEPLESRGQSGRESVSSSAIDWRHQFYRSFKEQHREIASQLNDDATPDEIERAGMISLGRVIGDLASESILSLLSEIGKGGKLGVTESDLARILFRVVPQSPHPFQFAEDREAVAWDYLLDETKPPGERETTLCFCAENDEDRTAAFIVDELEKDDLSAEWQDALVLCAESMQFHEDTIRARLWRRLLEIASRRRHDPDEAVSRPIVFSATRCLTSMMPVEELPQLLPLLEPPAPLETRLVTMQCIGNLFESGPPTAPDHLAGLRDRIHQLAIKFLDRDWLIAGERAAIALNAVQTLAWLGDERLADCISQVLALRMDWFARQLSRKLEEVSEAWGSIEHCSPLGLVRGQLALLRQALASTS